MEIKIKGCEIGSEGHCHKQERDGGCFMCNNYVTLKIKRIK